MPVVEDEQDVAELLRHILTKEGYEVVLLPNGADALKRARETKPELIVLDTMVPRLNCWQVCRRPHPGPAGINTNVTSPLSQRNMAAGSWG